MGAYQSSLDFEPVIWARLIQAPKAPISESFPLRIADEDQCCCRAAVKYTSPRFKGHYNWIKIADNVENTWAPVLDLRTARQLGPRARAY
jgi:hypothetical protein